MANTSDKSLSQLCPMLFRRDWPARNLADSISSIDVSSLCSEYSVLRKHAPCRSKTGKSYFVGHSGVPSSGSKSNRLEEHLAIALVNLKKQWSRANGERFQLLDYQVPLKARQTDAGVGKIDILGATDEGRLIIIELKVMSESRGRSDPPPAALMEGLRYAAMLEADLEALAREADQKLGIKLSPSPPIVLLLAPRSWWRSWRDLSVAGNWSQALAVLAVEIEAKTGLVIEFLELDDAEITYGRDGSAPKLEPIPDMT